MRTLSRPMFNMGGPIKQGIMTGIREPYAGGGQAGSGLVGHPAYPKTGGREHHVLPIWAGAVGLARLAPMLYRAISGAGKLKNISQAANLAAKSGKTFGNISQTYKLGKIGGAGGTWRGSTLSPGSNVGKQVAKIAEKTKAAPGFWRSAWERDPMVISAKWLKEAIMGPTAKGIGQKIVKGAVTPTGALTIGYFGGKWLWPDGTEATDKEVKKELSKKKGDKDYGPHTKDKLTLTQEQRDAKAKTDKEKRINELLDTMGYDKSRKDAAYNALIDAGRLVSERGTLDPKNIGRELIDPIVAATSARFDKPEQIREAVGLMKVKADIAKQMEDPQVAKLRGLEIEKGEKALAGATLEETAEAFFTRHGSWPSGELLGNLARNKGVNIVEVVDTSQAATGLKDIGDPVEFMEGRVKKFKDAGSEIPPGNYVVNKAIIIIDAEGNVSRR